MSVDRKFDGIGEASIQEESLGFFQNFIFISRIAISMGVKCQVSENSISFVTSELRKNCDVDPVDNNFCHNGKHGDSSAPERAKG